MNDFNDRLIRQTGIYFNDLLEGSGHVVFITNDRDNMSKSLNEGLESLNMHDYVNKYLHAYPEIFDLISASESYDVVADGEDVFRPVYSPYFNVKDLMQGLRTKKFLKGTIRVKRDNWTDCYVVVHASENKPRRSINVQGLWNYRYLCCHLCHIIFSRFKKR